MICPIVSTQGKTFDASKHVVKESKEELKLLKLKQKAKQLNLLDWAEEGAEIEEKVNE